MRLAPLLLGGWLAWLPGAGAWALQIQQQAERGLEDHSARLQLAQAVAGPRDSLNLQLKAEWRAGFRDYNRDSRRWLEQLLLDGTRRLEGPLRLRWVARQSLFNERRSLRETLASSLEGGVRWAGPLDLELLAGWMQDRRQTGYDQGPRARLALVSRQREGGWELAGRAEGQVERPGQRRNNLLGGVLDASWRGPEEQRDELSLTLRQQREDAFPNPLREALERRSSLQARVGNRFRGRWGAHGTFQADISGWQESQDRRPLDGQDSLGATQGSSLDRGLELRAEPSRNLGSLEGALAFVFRRQAQEAEYGQVGRVSRTLSTIALNRLEGRLLWRPGPDSLLAQGAVELRRRDSDFSGPVRRDPDYMDQTRRDLRLRWSHGWRPGARLGLEAGLTVGAERHLQASRSGSNYLNRTWRAGADHRAGLGGFQAVGLGLLVADYRLYDFEDSTDPRSWIQRRLQWVERLRRPLGSGPASWRLAWEGRARWMEEDGGSFQRGEGRQRISDSAREWELGTLLEGRRAPWILRPGWSWQHRLDWRWGGLDGSRERSLARHLVRQGPQLSLERESRRNRLALDLQWENVRDQGTQNTARRRSLRAKLDWHLRW